MPWNSPFRNFGQIAPIYLRYFDNQTTGDRILTGHGTFYIERKLVRRKTTMNYIQSILWGMVVYSRLDPASDFDTIMKEEKAGFGFSNDINNVDYWDVLY